MTSTASPARPDTEVVFDPATYTSGVPFEALARLRRDTPVAWVPEIPVLGWPEGPGFWLVLRHADVESVLKRPALFSSALGATQIRDPATPQALGYVRRMMLNMDPPGHSRLRRLLSRSFTPRAVAQLEDRIRGHARAICGHVFTGPRGECDFAKDVAADLPLLTLADVLGVPEQDRWLLFDWSNRVIGYQDPDYASSAEFDPAQGMAMAREALSVRPVFGHGPHFCLGAHLARTQIRALFAEVLARTSSLAYAGPPSYLRSNFQRGVKRLPVAWTA